jgi:cytoplasmic iron level regulating protein YaaA (DUF328/UPF0246 family)
MLFLLSPAKSLDYESPIGAHAATAPMWTAQAALLIEQLRALTPKQVAALMDISDKLAELNVRRYQNWRKRPGERNVRQAMLAFDGDVYDGLRARTLSAEQLDWAQQRVCILSGLYGVLRPLDRMQPYRLEMGSALSNARGANLYAFWGKRIAQYLNQRLRDEVTPVVVNLASQEYARAVDRKALQVPVVDCVFEEWRGGQYKVISFSAKRARGQMMRFAIENQISLPGHLQAFCADGYAFDRQASSRERLVFRRSAPAAESASA